MFTFGHIPLTGGNGDYKVRSLKVTIASVDYFWSGVSLLDGDGEALIGQKARSESLPATLSAQDILAILASGAPAQGFVPIPASTDEALAVPVRAVLVTSAGNVAVETADGTNNDANPIVGAQPGLVVNVAAVRRTGANTAGVIGMVGFPAL